ncbi:MAG: hypothetical protein ACR2N7_11900, partial [Acidimicrobiia bacterium]
MKFEDTEPLYPLEISRTEEDLVLRSGPIVREMSTPLPAATVARLPRYLRCLSDMAHTSTT